MIIMHSTYFKVATALQVGDQPVVRS